MSTRSKDGGDELPARRDTPVDVPAVQVRAAGTLPTAHASLETLEAAYAVWAEERARHAAALLRQAEERRRIEDEAAFVVGAVRAATASPVPDSPGVLAAPNELSGFVRDAEARIAAAREALAARTQEEEAAFQRRFAGLRAQLRDQLVRLSAVRRPLLRVVPRRLAGDGRIVHVERVSADDAVLLLFLITGKLASRYGFLHDDATDDVTLPPPPLYPEEGVSAVRVGAAALERWISETPEVLPLKGFLPLSVPRPGAAPAFYRLLQRGPVMELELAEGERFRNVLTREEAEHAAGHLIRLKLAGKIELVLSAE